MIKCLAIDDEPLALRQLAAYIQKIPFLELVEACQSALDARAIMDRELIDAIFVDINMPDLNGMEFVKSLSAPPLVVFTTAYSEYAVDGFKVDAVDYLLKPFGLDDLKRAASKVKRQYEMLNGLTTPAAPQSLPVQETEDNVLFLKTEHRVVRVDVSTIRYVEGMSEYLKIYFDEARPLTVLLSMKKLEGKLPGNRFMRVHKSFIINLSKISQVSKGHVRMQDGSSIPIGESYRDSLLSYINSKSLVK